ncbi:MAG TPA: ATP-binding protein [Terriglobales bacterium]|jgi:signal transduction histidine kinase|nr:ATP-binding protein [Terriglobales bacterium]
MTAIPIALADPRPTGVSPEGSEEFLARAFASFAGAAASLERSYVYLQGEVTRLRRELEQTNRELESSLEENARLQRQQALAEMSSVLAHEIRNPLGSLELFAGVLAESELTEQQARWVEHLQAGLRMLAATVNNVLHFHSRPQLGFAPTDLAELLRSLIQFLRPLAQRAGVHLEYVCATEGILVAADRDRLRQVLLNLALNSFHFMPEGGSLKISAATRDMAACILVSDSGCGIAPNHLASIFEPGFTTRAGSPGLGLAVCRTIMEQHRGTISVFSQLGQGTTFTLELPLWKEEQ